MVPGTTTTPEAPLALGVGEALPVGLSLGEDWTCGDRVARGDGLGSGEGEADGRAVGPRVGEGVLDGLGDGCRLAVTTAGDWVAVSDGDGPFEEGDALAIDGLGVGVGDRPVVAAGDLVAAAFGDDNGEGKGEGEGEGECVPGGFEGLAVGPGLAGGGVAVFAMPFGHGGPNASSWIGPSCRLLPCMTRMSCLPLWS
jgi:hypothetical protein